MENEEFEIYLQKTDLQASSLLGLGKRMELCILDPQMVSLFQEKVKQRVANLWEKKHGTVRTYEMDLLLQAI